MICIEVDMKGASTSGGIDDAVRERLQAASLFGRLVIRNLAMLPKHQGLRLAEACSGCAEWYGDATELDLSTALEWLNAGCARMIVTFQQGRVWRRTIPLERMIVRVAGNSDLPMGWDPYPPPMALWLDDEAILEDLEMPTTRWEWIATPWRADAPTLSKRNCRRLFVVREEKLANDPQRIANWYFDQLVSDRADGLIPTIVADPLGIALGLAYSNRGSFAEAIARRVGAYWSRSRQELWIKGATSGAGQRLLQVAVDCDHDTIRFTVEQEGRGFCHRGSYSCFATDRNLSMVFRRIQQRIAEATPGSYSHRLAQDDHLLARKLAEESQELAEAKTPHEVAWEAADVTYFAMVAAARADVDWSAISHELARRMQRIVRRD